VKKEGFEGRISIAEARVATGVFEVKNLELFVDYDLPTKSGDWTFEVLTSGDDLSEGQYLLRMSTGNRFERSDQIVPEDVFFVKFVEFNPTAHTESPICVKAVGDGQVDEWLPLSSLCRVVHSPA
jgi:hypothetical protein